jgi:hypothetical protein
VTDLACLTVVQTQTEAELLCNLLRIEGIGCVERATNYGAALELPQAGPREVLVAPSDLDRARALLGDR